VLVFVLRLVYFVFLLVIVNVLSLFCTRSVDCLYSIDSALI